MRGERWIALFALCVVLALLSGCGVSVTTDPQTASMLKWAGGSFNNKPVSTVNERFDINRGPGGKVDDPKQFFKGCSLTPALPSGSGYRISGACLDHSFAENYDMTKEKFAFANSICLVTPRILEGTSTWAVNFCVVDGKPVVQAHFSLKTRKMFHVRYQIDKAEPPASVENIKIMREMQTSGRYEGCTISHPADNPYKRVITGSCAGHVFKYPEFLLPSSEVNFCRLQDLDNGMSVGDCIIDGVRRQGTTEISPATEARMKLQAEAPTKYQELVARAQARSKVDPVFLGIVLGEQWDQQSVNKCSGSEPRTKIIPFCAYGDKDGLTSHDGVSWTDCVAIDREAFDITWLGMPGGELLTKRSDCRVYVSVLSDGTVGKISMVTSSRLGDVAQIKTDLIKKYGNQYDSKSYVSEVDQRLRRLYGDLYPQQFPEETVHLWTLPGLWVSYREQVYAHVGIQMGVLEIHTGAPASVTVEKSKPKF